MSGDGTQFPTKAPGGFDAYDDARAIVKLFQCSQCSYPLREPISLPCGDTICRPCLPPLYKRENITYPVVEGRADGFLCPFKRCGLEHSIGDCGTDVTLNNVVYLVKGHIAKYKTALQELPLLLEEKLNGPPVVDSSMDVMPRSRVLQGGRIVATYILADMGELRYDSDLAYTPVAADSLESARALDVGVLESLREIIRPEVECQVCYQIMLDPLTTCCGHTFCRKCFARAMDHSHYCPMCRRRLPTLSSVQSEPSNKRITHLIQHLWPDLLAARKAMVEQEDAIDEETRLPLFPCTLSFPQMPTFLHIFEPRYRLMIRRVLQNGSRKFGMLPYREPGFAPGEPHYKPYGTVLFIERIEMLPDGRSLIGTRGQMKFRVVETSMLDGYLIGQVQRVDDIPVHEEEAIESLETRAVPAPFGGEIARIQCMSTQGLLENGLEFVERARSQSARWLHQRVLDTYGQPPSDPAIFPYWLASVLPISEYDKYQLLPATSVRERLKITAVWISKLEEANA
ncbi:uncharacterized protein Z518_08763 [Rhinocladiella mackenziei CBS 650.93]|uniref:Rhinocladiella mackenziei CBS 650.93 unplaced genomic scaffold supercont1.6, whole genome shotgun sequence n=1 Tax=Rhinocladiella mackenziei CBS 650.93 TaxID=1442369 RepID=A0A0D2J1P3_9EURO|nr:uncharacterized protein Z518_08763 [Rhinocladiella mackenziei CBS 650.93]KIX02820.1 hypothetical protein Z518_08763 [Rhinocladiella mackenziei CBS 650.93]